MIAKRVTAITSLLLTLAASCHHGAFANTPVGTQGAVGLVVQNQNFYDMDLYVVSEGVATRVGDVPGKLNHVRPLRALRPSFALARRGRLFLSTRAISRELERRARPNDHVHHCTSSASELSFDSLGGSRCGSPPPVHGRSENQKGTSTT